MPKAYASVVIDAPADAVWAHIRDFNGLPKWHPGAKDSRIEDGRPADAIGCVRKFQLQDGTHIRERLLAMSDADRFYTYSFETTPFPVRNYHCTLRVTPVVDGNRSFVEWFTTFDVAEAIEKQWIDTFANAVFMAGLQAIKKHFGA